MSKKDQKHNSISLREEILEEFENMNLEHLAPFYKESIADKVIQIIEKRIDSMTKERNHIVGLNDCIDLIKKELLK